MNQPKVSVVGGSNCVIGRYLEKSFQKENFNFKNYSIGSTSSIYGLLNILKHNIIKDSDVLIFEYHLNDTNWGWAGWNNVEKVKSTLEYIILSCFKNKTKLIFLLFYRKSLLKNFIYKHSPIHEVYIDYIKKYNIPFIDVRDYLPEDTNGFYRDENHLSLKSHEIIARKIKNILPKLNFLENIDELIKTKFKPKTLKAEDLFGSCLKFKNNLIESDYFEISDYNEIILPESSKILAIEFLCDQKSGLIEISNGFEKIQKRTKRVAKFIRDGKTISSILIFESKILQASNFYSFKIISADQLDKEILDQNTPPKDRYISSSDKDSSFKLVSLLTF